MDRCRRASWAERSLVNLARPKPEDVERAKKFIDYVTGKNNEPRRNQKIEGMYDPPKTTAELDAQFEKKPARKKRPSDFLKRIGFTPAELGTIMSWAKHFKLSTYAAEILRKVSR